MSPSSTLRSSVPLPAEPEARPRRPGPGRPPKPVVEYPEPLWEPVEAPHDFAAAFDAEIRRHGDSVWGLHKATTAKGGMVDRTTLGAWRRGTKGPQTPASLQVVDLIENRYRLPRGYLRSRVTHGRAVSGHRLPEVGAAERRRLAWHLPDDFNARTASEQAEILAWVRSSVLSGGTAFHRYHAEVSKHRFAIRFEGVVEGAPLRSGHTLSSRPEFAPPPRLAREMADLLRFKTRTLTEVGFQRSGVWGPETASQKVEHLGLLFGALTVGPDSVSRGFGLPRERLTFALLVSPAVWDWYVQWRETRRGFYTGWEAEMLLLAAALTRSQTGWLRQNPALASELEPVEGLISEDDVRRMRDDWDGACERVHRHALARAKEIQRVARVHRDPFEPLLPVLEAASPVGEYLKITREILLRMPHAGRHPRAAAESVRAFLMIRLGLHLGLRQKNLRQLLVRLRGQTHTSERELERLKRGELRWSDRDAGWDGLLRTGELCDPGYRGHGRRSLWSLPAAGQGGPCRPGPQSGLERQGGLRDGPGAGRRLISALPASGRAQEVADSPAIQAARGDDPVVDDDPAAAATHRDAVQGPAARERRQPVAGGPAGGAVQLGRIEIGEPDLDPGRRVGAGTDAETVPVADVADLPGEGLPRAIG